MIERPILFSAPMVRAILSGQKMVTRRPIKHQPDVPVTDAIPRREYPHGPATIDWYWRPRYGHLNGVPSNGWDFKCPYGQPGDRLWVRETFALLGNEDGVCIDWNDNLQKGDEKSAAKIYKASCSQGDYGLWEIPDKADWKPDTADMLYEGAWRPSIHMPRWACRILLEVTSVRVELLQAISQADAIAEGVMICERDLDQDGNDYSPSELFSMLWVSINGHDSWNANPWVWVVEFKRVELADV